MRKQDQFHLLAQDQEGQLLQLCKNSNPCQCPFRQPISYFDTSTRDLSGRPNLVLKPFACSTECQAFEILELDRIQLHCTKQILKITHIDGLNKKEVQK